MKSNATRLLISLVVIAMLAVGLRNILQLPGFPLTIDRHTLEISPLLGMPLPSGLQKGDAVDWVRADRTTRMEIWDVTPGVGTEIELPILRSGEPMSVRLRTVSMIDAGGLGSLIAPAFFFWGLMLVIGLLSLWRGSDAVATGLSVSALSMVAMAPLGNPAFNAPPEWLPVIVIAVTAGQAMCSFGAVFGWFWMARALAQPLLPRSRLRWITAGFAAIVLLRASIYFAGLAMRLTTDRPPNLLDSADSLLYAARLLPILGLYAFVLLRASGASRRRAQWIGWSVALMQTETLMNLFLPSLANSAGWQLAGLLVDLVGGAGLLYAALRHRMIEIAFVLNRAVVFAVITTAVVGIFALVENLLEQMAVGQKTGLAIQLGVPLLLGIAINSVHSRVEHFIEQVIFRQRHRREIALKALAHRASFIETESALLDQTVDELMRNAGSPSVAIYDRSGRHFRRLQAAGEAAYPVDIDADDPACVVLKAGAPLVNLESCRSALGGSGLVLPMMQQGRLAGFLVCAARPAEDYAPDERELFALVAREAGTALRSLRAQESEQLIAALGAGMLDAAQVVDAARNLQRRRGVAIAATTSG